VQKKYKLKEKDCKLTFCDLDSTDKNQRKTLIQQLKTIGIENPMYVKKIWVKYVLEQNGLDQHQIQEILDFKYSQLN